MPRMARVVVPGLPHHVTQRGVRSLDVFGDDGDRLAYLSLMREAGAKHGLKFIAWCLMTNHVHLVAVPREKGSLAGAIREAHWRYTRMVNFREGVRGHLFQERFASYPVQRDAHLLAVGRYVELNPVRAALVERADAWEWSSAAYNAGARRSDPLVTSRRLAEVFGSWRKVLRRAETEEGARRIELHLGSGRPLGTQRWISALERTEGRPLRAGKPGWPAGRPRGSSKKREK